jgi:hypothetical protein
MDNRARYSPEFAESEILDPNVMFSPDSAPRGSDGFRFPVDLNASLDLRHRILGSTADHVTDGTVLPRSLFSGVSRSAHQVFDNTSDVSMGDDDVSFLILYTYCRPSASQTRFFA